MFSHSCPLPSARLVWETPTKENAPTPRSYITVYTIWERLSVNGGCHIKARNWHTCHRFRCVSVCRVFLGGAWGVEGGHQRGDDVLISWRRVSTAVWFGSNVYIWTAGTNRACGSFTMQGEMRVAEPLCQPTVPKYRLPNAAWAV